MKKIKNVMTASILIVGIIIGVTYASVQNNTNSTNIKPEGKLFINTNPDYDKILIGGDFWRNWSISMPNSSIDLNKHNDTHDSFSMVYNDTELFSFLVDKNTSMDIRDMLSELVNMIQYYSSYVEPQEIALSDSNTFHYYYELLGIWCNPV